METVDELKIKICGNLELGNPRMIQGFWYLERGTSVHRMEEGR